MVLRIEKKIFSLFSSGAILFTKFKPYQIIHQVILQCQWCNVWVLFSPDLGHRLLLCFSLCWQKQVNVYYGCILYRSVKYTTVSRKHGFQIREVRGVTWWPRLLKGSHYWLRRKRKGGNCGFARRQATDEFPTIADPRHFGDVRWQFCPGRHQW